MTASLMALVSALLGRDKPSDEKFDTSLPMRRCDNCKRWLDARLRLERCPNCGADLEEPNGNALGA